ncbi:MAG: hypothetical protein JNL70_01255 [Saprospiraceae bacterium]|nr:hypothetical protein [Saprospiraceae bacterium]
MKLLLTSFNHILLSFKSLLLIFSNPMSKVKVLINGHVAYHSLFYNLLSVPPQ